MSDKEKERDGRATRREGRVTVLFFVFVFWEGVHDDGAFMYALRRCSPQDGADHHLYLVVLYSGWKGFAHGR